MKVLVTGASGLLGATLTSTALVRGCDVVAAYNNHPTKFDCENVALPLSDRKSISSVLRHRQFDWVLHCAAATDVDWCELNPEECTATNSVATEALAAFCKAVGAKLFYMSTESVFDGRHGSYSEADDPSPLNVYSRSKLSGETKARELLSDALIARGTIYGWNLQNKECFAESIVRRLSAGETVPGFTDALFSPLYVGDMSKIILDAISLSLSGTYHIGSRDSISKFDFARHIAATFGYDPANIYSVKLADARLNAPRPLNVALDVTRITRDLGEMPSVKNGIDAFYSTYKSGGVAKLKSKGAFKA